MKTLISVLVLMVGITTELFSENIIAKGSSQSELGNYTIAQTSQPTRYTMQYQNSEILFTIEVCKEANCCYYLVSGNGITLAYSCESYKFGICPDGNGKCNPNNAAGKLYLDELSINRQQKIDAGQKKPEEAMGLIACYFHELIKKDKFSEFFQLKA